MWSLGAHLPKWNGANKATDPSSLEALPGNLGHFFWSAQMKFGLRDLHKVTKLPCFIDSKMHTLPFNNSENGIAPYSLWCLTPLNHGQLWSGWNACVAWTSKVLATQWQQACQRCGGNPRDGSGHSGQWALWAVGSPGSGHSWQWTLHTVGTLSSGHSGQWALPKNTESPDFDGTGLTVWINTDLIGWESRPSSKLDSECEEVVGILNSFFWYFPFI